VYRNSYRGERVSHDETIHKVYVATDVRWGERIGVNLLKERLWPTRPGYFHASVGGVDSRA
jgi:hypothetical protein